MDRDELLAGDARSAGRPLLILDLGGVVYADAFPVVAFDEVAAAAGVPRAEVHGWYLEHARSDLWDGSMDEQAFWDGLLSAFATGAGAGAWRARLLDGFTPLPACARIAGWSERTELWCLSNNRHEWIEPKLHEWGIHGAFERLMISSRSRLVKPAPDVFTRLAEMVCGRDARFVDDNPRNVTAAEAAGVTAILADGGGAWIETVDAWLSAAARPDLATRA